MQPDAVKKLQPVAMKAAGVGLEPTLVRRLEPDSVLLPALLSVRSPAALELSRVEPGRVECCPLAQRGFLPLPEAAVQVVEAGAGARRWRLSRRYCSVASCGDRGCSFESRARRSAALLIFAFRFWW